MQLARFLSLKVWTNQSEKGMNHYVVWGLTFNDLSQSVSLCRLTVPQHISGSVFHHTLPAIMEVSRFWRSAISEPKNSRVSLEGSEVSVKVTWSLGVESLLLFTWGCKTKHAHANINTHTDMVMIKYECKICIIFQQF